MRVVSRRLSALALACACAAAGAAPAAAGEPAARPGLLPAAHTHGPDPVAVDRGPQAPLGAPRAVAARRSARAVRIARPRGWCGSLRSTDDTVNERDTGGARYHAVLMVPSDSGTRLRKVASQLQADAFRASALLESLYGRAIRFDMGNSCGPQYLDISVVRMPESRRALERLAPSPTATIEAVGRALNRAGFPSIVPSSDFSGVGAERSYAVWLDGPGPPGTCGQATHYPDRRRSAANFNDHGGAVAVVFREGGGFCGANTLRHEIAHNLGAVQAVAPHAFDGVHCNDAYEDTMCFSSAPRRADGRHQSLFFDWRNDDYWDPPGGAPLPWWTVNLSRFLCPGPDCNLAAGADLDGDRDTVRDDLDNCARIANGSQGDRNRDGIGDACAVRLAVSRKRRGGDRWKVALRAEGRGRARLWVACPGADDDPDVTLWARRVRLPKRAFPGVRCERRPFARGEGIGG